MRRAIARAGLRTRLKHLRRAKKSTPCLIKKASRRAADRTSKTTTFFIFHYLWITKILRQNHTYLFILLFHWFSGENWFLKFKKFTGKHKTRISFLINLQAPLTSLLIILTWKSLNILYRKLMKFFKVLPKENLKSAYKR